MLQLDVQSLALLAGTAVPGLVGVVAKANAERWFKVAVNALFSVAVAAGVLVVAADGSVHLGDWVFQGIITWGLSELAYQRLYRPAGVAAFLRRRFPGGVGPVAVDRLSPLPLTSGPLRQESEERGLAGSAGGVERLPIEVQEVAPASDGMPSDAFMHLAGPVDDARA